MLCGIHTRNLFQPEKRGREKVDTFDASELDV